MPDTGSDGQKLLYYRSVPAVPCRPTRREHLAVGLLLLLVLVLHLWAIHFGLDPLDEGYFLYTSSRVFAGEIPYRDFSTPYTPAFFYLNALVFKLFGLEVVNLRLAMLVPRLGVLVLTYLLGRRIMPAPFALLPAFVLLADDPSPGVWESHPAWWAIFLAVLSVWCVCRYRERGRFGWWVAAGLAAAASFAFKQNLGLFSAAGLVALALAEEAALPGLRGPAWLERIGVPLPSRLAGLIRRSTGPAALVGLLLGATWGMRAHPDPGMLLVLAAPFAALALERLRRRGCADAGLPGASVGRPAATRARLGVVLASFVLVNLPWIAALTLAIGAGQTPYGAFVGAIDSAGYYYQLEPPRPGAIPLLGLVILLPAGLWALFRPWPWLLRLGVVGGMLALGVGLAAELFAQAPEVDPRPARANLLLSVDAAQNLILYLPALAFWAALGLLLTNRIPSPSRFYLCWYLLAGSLLLLNQFPRFDETHLPHSAPVLYVVGGYVLWRLHQVLARGLGSGLFGHAKRAALLLALLGLPLAAVLPMVEARRSQLLVREDGGPLRFRTAQYEWLDLPGVNVYDLPFFAEKWRRLNEYFRDYSQPGERIFVYPAAPLLYYLVDRPNASRFAHLLPGLLTPDDERETIQRLETMPVRFVIWDTFGADFWERPSAYQMLEDYIWATYDPVASIGGFEVLRRRGT